MDLHEAHEVLGIDETVEAKQARRAYLKLLKKHRPESDPEGFQRIREAHEIVSAHRSMFGHAAPALPETTSAAPLTDEVGPPPSEPEAPPLSWQERVWSDVEEQRKADSPPNWPSFFDARLAENPPPDEIWDLYYELEEDEQIAAELLRAASRADVPGFEDSLVMTLPQLANEQELAAIQESDCDSSTLFSVFLAAGDLERAGPAAMQALDTEHSDNISGYHLLELLFALESSGSLRGGPLLFEKINEHIARELDERTLFGHCTPSWMLATEYFSMNFRLQPIGRIFVGNVCRTLDWDHAPELAMNWRPPSPHKRSSVVPPVRSILSTYAPTMMSVLFPSASTAPSPEPQMTISGPGVPWWTTLFVLLGALRLLRACIPEDDTSEPPLTSSQKMLQETLREKERIDERQRAADGLAPAEEVSPPATTHLAPSQVEPGSNELQAGDWYDLRQVSVARFHQGAIAEDCQQMDRALANLAWYQKRAPDDQQEKTAAETERLNTEYAEKCPVENENDEE